MIQTKMKTDKIFGYNQKLNFNESQKCDLNTIKTYLTIENL